ncbi:Cysteine-rich DPF motif domain-containing protein isoform 1 [Schistosoma japonicum]|uniref:Cysteine-rich DPF motif domain-containing protein 1 n=2 Tax=Schistosoma japonicum TaxID=6182 RepID=A0A4Z2CZ34_SCHJA|nr:cysteine-rich DPF motif domain-containing protein 1 [Schistosoma japonicum]TNN09492.1 Cysteine-rich DPF motif domain-containing protein isoform 1 [Schistosoma japonicum]
MSSDVQNEFFHCTLCDFKIRYDYKGNNPPFFKKEIKFLESVYCIRDPFADDNLGGIILGGDCSTCGKSVCVSQNCSMYNLKRCCLYCAKVGNHIL